jgi:DNA-3-methyladenine glycosylase I
MKKEDEIKRCDWARSEILIAYHDREWGAPLHEERDLFEFLVLEGMQAGLSWEIILRRRDNYRVAFDRFDPGVVAAYGPDKIAELLADPGIIRNRLKIEAAIQNAKSFLLTQQEFGGFDAYVWKFVGGEPIQNHRRSSGELPAQTPESEALSKDLRGRGFKFVGPTICYAFMQATGMVNDHLERCFRYKELSAKTPVIKSTRRRS